MAEEITCGSVSRMEAYPFAFEEVNEQLLLIFGVLSPRSERDVWHGAFVCDGFKDVRKVNARRVTGFAPCDLTHNLDRAGLAEGHIEEAVDGGLCEVSCAVATAPYQELFKGGFVPVGEFDIPGDVVLGNR